MTDPLIRQGHSTLSTVIDPKEYNSEGCVCVDQPDIVWTVIPSIGELCSDNNYCIACYSSFTAFVRTTLVTMGVLLFQVACRSAQSFENWSDYGLNNGRSN